MENFYRKETISFRFTKLSPRLLPKLKNATKGIELAINKKKGRKSLVVVFDVDEKQNFDELCHFISREKISPLDYGLWISLGTEKDMDGVRLPEFAANLHRKIGGRLDFSFIFIEQNTIKNP